MVELRNNGFVNMVETTGIVSPAHYYELLDELTLDLLDPSNFTRFQSHLDTMRMSR